jgi:hypothetical protein
VDGDLYVVPRRPGTVGGAERAGLLVAAMGVVVLAAVAQVDAAEVRDVPLRVAAVAQHDQLLVVGAAGAYPHVEKALAAGGLDLLAQVAVLALVVPEPVQM